ncbi:MAG: ATP-binding cassette domain-containing protein [Dehalococcoidia bacterium]|nr:ATP-binding cassette domain-containing protein [Dehalococcoidia bacterium]
MIEADNLTKYYGSLLGIQGLSFQMERGEVLGFLGPNGAGKTTAMRILTGFMPPTSGSARIAGYDVNTQSLEARRHIGYLPETVPLYTEMTVTDYLTYMGTLRGMASKQMAHRIAEVIGVCHLEEYRLTYISKLSKGFRQRVGIAQAILHEPDVLILDEPTIGIDPIQVVETRQLIKGLGGNHTVILSSHILPEVSMVCDRVLIIHEGRVVAIDTPANLSAHLRSTQRIEAEVRGPSAEVMPLLRELNGVQDVRRQGDGLVATYVIEARPGADLREPIATLVVQRGWGLLRLQSVEMSLEEIFLRLTTSEEQ